MGSARRLGGFGPQAPWLTLVDQGRLAGNPRLGTRDSASSGRLGVIHGRLGRPLRGFARHACASSIAPSGEDTQPTEGFRERLSCLRNWGACRSLLVHLARYRAVADTAGTHFIKYHRVKPERCVRIDFLTTGHYRAFFPVAGATWLPDCCGLPHSLQPESGTVSLRRTRSTVTCPEFRRPQELSDRTWQDRTHGTNPRASS